MDRRRPTFRRAGLPGRHLARQGILGTSQRDAELLLPRNARWRYPLVDDKLRTKHLAEQAGIAVPELYEVIELHRQIRDLDAMLDGREDLVVKPANGSGGNGILVIDGRLPHGYRKANGALATHEEPSITSRTS